MIAAGAFGVILMLSACAGQSADAPAATPTVSPSSTATAATPTPSATSTPTPTPTADAVSLDAPESWLIGFTGIGPLHVGDQISSASQAMTAFTGTTYDGCPSVVSYDRPDSPTILIPDRLGTGVVEQVVLQGGADPVALAAASPHTVEGIGIGSTLDAVTSAYPAITYQDDKYTPHYAVTDGSGNWINISVTDDIVTGIVVRASTVVAKEYCS